MTVRIRVIPCLDVAVLALEWRLLEKVARGEPMAMSISRSWPLATYAIAAAAILWAAHATDPSVDFLAGGILVSLFGLQQMYYFQLGRVSVGRVEAERTKQPETFWLVHGTLQAFVFFVLCFPWIERIAS